LTGHLPSTGLLTGNAHPLVDTLVDMIDWLTDVFLSFGGLVASWFVLEGTASYHVIQGLAAMLLITSCLALIACRPKVQTRSTLERDD
jgi:hypothetical protein